MFHGRIPQAGHERQPDTLPRHSAQNGHRFATIPGDGATIAPHLKLSPGTASGTAARAVLRASILPFSRDSLLSQQVERALRRVAFPPRRPCSICWESYPVAVLTQRPDLVAAHSVVRICPACLELEAEGWRRDA